MTSQEVIDVVKRLKPNAYSDEDLLSWISDVDCYIRSNIVKYYGTDVITTEPGITTYSLPPGVRFEDIEYVFFNGRRVDKYNFPLVGINGNGNFININPNQKITVTIHYLIRLPRYRYVEYISKPGEITFGINYIQTSGAEFKNLLTEDLIEISGCTVNTSNNKQAVIKGGTTTQIEFDDNTFTAGVEPGVITIKRILNDNLIVPEPYDKMYKEYLFAMIDFHNREYESYNNNVIMYNNTLEEFAKWYKQRSPIDRYSKIYNIW
jgi:hypothetical protein